MHTDYFKFMGMIIGILFLCGCGHMYGSIRIERKLPEVTYKVPVKFYVNSVKLHNFEEMNSAGNASTFKQYWPDFFTDNPQKGIKVDFTLTVERNEKFSGSIFPLFLLHMLSYGFIPIVDSFEQPASLSIVLEKKLYKRQTLWEEGKKCASFSLLGILLANYRWYSPAEAQYSSSFLLENKLHKLHPEKLRSFLQVFVDSLRVFPKEDVEKLYINKTVKQNLLM